MCSEKNKIIKKGGKEMRKKGNGKKCMGTTFRGLISTAWLKDWFDRQIGMNGWGMVMSLGGKSMS